MPNEGMPRKREKSIPLPTTEELIKYPLFVLYKKKECMCIPYGQPKQFPISACCSSSIEVNEEKRYQCQACGKECVVLDGQQPKPKKIEPLDLIRGDLHDDCLVAIKDKLNELIARANGEE